MTSTLQNGLLENFATETRSSEYLELKDGGQIPGYRGHCPTLRFDYGKTYGQGIHEAYQTRKGFQTTGAQATTGGQQQQQQRSLAAETGQPISTKKGQLRGSLPRSTGDNKYTEDMVSGYTGYIPRYPFKFGATYKDECDICLDEHFSNMRRQEALRLGPGRAGADGGPQKDLKPLRQDPEVRDHLNEFGTSVTSAKATPRRGVYRPPVLERDCELPIPGYAGFVPRVGVTEVGLGTRYTPQTKDGLDWFYAEQARRADLLSTNPGGTSRSRDRAADSFTQADLTRSLVQSALQSSNRGRAEASLASRDVISPPATDAYVCEHRAHNPGGVGSFAAETTKAARPNKAVSFVV